MGKIIVSNNMRGKMDGITAINTLPTSRCAKRMRDKNSICAHCYAKQSLRYPSALKAYTNNAKLLRTDKNVSLPDLFISSQWIRFNAIGELENETELLNFYRIAKANPYKRFSLWTKEKEIIHKAGIKNKPKNLQLIYSSNKLNEREEIPYGFSKVFTVYTSEFAERNKIKIHCKQNCRECGLCYAKNRIKYVNELKKRNT